MKTFSERLASLQLTTIVLGILGFWFAWGVLLAESDPYDAAFRFMNSVLVPAWFLPGSQVPPLMKFWFIGLCFFMFILGVNLAVCSWNRFVRFMRNGVAKARMVMLLIHAVFGLVALGHFGSFLLGYRYENVALREGRSFDLPGGYAIVAQEIHFEGDVKSLHLAPKDMIPGVFRPEASFCEVSLTRGGIELARGKVYLMDPFAWKDIQVTLKRFTPPKVGTGQGANTTAGPGVKLIVSRNPVKGLVLSLFPVMVAGIAVYLAMTWRAGPTDKGS